MNDMMANNQTALAGIELTEVGINAPSGLTMEQWETIASEISRYESGRAWFLGDLYNLWPKGRTDPTGDDNSRRARCEELGLNYGTMRKNASIASAFTMLRRRNEVTFGHHYEVAALPEPEQDELLNWAINAGKIASIKKLRDERDRRKGITKKATTPTSAETTEELVHNVLDAVPKSTSKTTRKAIEREVKKAASTLSQEFDRAVHKTVSDELKERRISLQEKEKKAEEQFEHYTNLAKNVDGILTREEFRFVRGVLHPDRAPADRKADFTRAFRLFNRLEEAVNKWR